MWSPTKTLLTFKVSRQNPELIPPAEPTPHEFKPLSDIDDQVAFRFQIPVIQFYRRDPSMDGHDPARILRSAIARALVPYYPFAGRLREHAARKLAVDCTGEGVLFIEADADVTLLQFGDNLHPPFPCIEELLYDVPGSDGVIGCPLMLIQVTRLRCGGFILALRLNHTMSDAVGLVQFMSAVGELARGAAAPSVSPVWDRHLLNAPRAHDHVVVVAPDPVDDCGIILEDRSFFFGPAEISALRSRLPPHLRRRSAFEIITACLWRCRTIAMSPDPADVARVFYLVDYRKRLSPPLPGGYYGNAVATPGVVSGAGELCEKPLSYALELITKTKLNLRDEYCVRSLSDLMADVSDGRQPMGAAGVYLVSDLVHAGFADVDYGWGKAAYGGVGKVSVGSIVGVSSFFVRSKNKKGESGVVVPVGLPVNAMGMFMKELRTMLLQRDDDDDDYGRRSESIIIPSAL